MGAAGFTELKNRSSYPPHTIPGYGSTAGHTCLSLAHIAGRTRLARGLPDGVVEEDLIHGGGHAHGAAVGRAARNAGPRDGVQVTGAASDVEVQHERGRIGDVDGRTVRARGVGEEVDPVGDRTEADHRLVIGGGVGGRVAPTGRGVRDVPDLVTELEFVSARLIFDVVLHPELVRTGCGAPTRIAGAVRASVGCVRVLGVVERRVAENGDVGEDGV